MIVSLTSEQAEMLKRAGIEYSPDMDYDISDLEDAITNYVMRNEIVNSDTTEFGEELLAVHDLIVETYDS